jgi:predicted nuclease of predicted toxin-antitoxin system
VNILLDQNISFRVTQLLSSTFGNVRQVKELGLVDASDLEIWNYAFKNNYTIITFDSDFIDLSNLKGSPPKIIWLRFGNSSNLKIANKLLSKTNIIDEFVLNDNPEIAFLEID